MKAKLSFLILSVVILTSILSGCKDNNNGDLLQNCCNGGITSPAKTYTLFLPNAVTPDMDGINDRLSILTRPHFGVLAVVDFVAKNENKDVVFSADTLYKNTNEFDGFWDMTDNKGDTLFGMFDISFRVIDTSLVSHQIKTTVCSIDCLHKPPDNSGITLDNCVFEDQFDIDEGKIVPQQSEGGPCGWR